MYFLWLKYIVHRKHKIRHSVSLVCLVANNCKLHNMNAVEINP